MRSILAVVFAFALTNPTWAQPRGQGDVNFVVELDDQAIESLRQGKTLESVIPPELRGNIDIIRIRYKPVSPPAQSSRFDSKSANGRQTSSLDGGSFRPDAGPDGPRAESVLLTAGVTQGNNAQTQGNNAQPPSAPPLLPGGAFQDEFNATGGLPERGREIGNPANRFQSGDSGTPSTGGSASANSPWPQGRADEATFHPPGGRSLVAAAPDMGSANPAARPAGTPVFAASDGQDSGRDSRTGPRQQPITGHTAPDIRAHAPPSIPRDRNVRLANNTTGGDGFQETLRPPLDTQLPASGPQSPAEGIILPPPQQAGGSSLLLWLIVFASMGLNVYLGWISRGFYVRYRELADELRQTFVAAA